MAAAAVNTLNGAAITNVEVLNVRAVHTGAFAAAVDANNIVGLTSFNNTLSTAAVSVTNLQDPAVVTVTGNGAVTNGNTTAAYVAGATSGDLVVSGGTTAGDIAVNGTGLTSLAIVSNGAANTVGALSTNATPATVTINAATAFTTTGLTVGTLAAGGQTLTISGAAANVAATATAAATGAVNLGTLDADFVTVNASGLTNGGISATLNSATAKVTGGAGNDFITTNGALTSGTVDAGAGTADRLIVSNTADLATTALGAKFTNFEHIQAQNGVTVNLDNISGITNVYLNDAGGTTVLQNLTATQAANITVLASAGASTIDVKGAATAGQIDTVALTFDNGNTVAKEAGTNSTFTLSSVENLKIIAVDNVDITQSAAASGALSNVTISGAGNVSFETGNIATANFVVDASASTGTINVNASAFATNGVSITGGAGNDIILGSAQADVLKGGAGNDILGSGFTLTAGAVSAVTASAAADTLTGGAGNDTYAIGVSSVANASTIVGLDFGTAAATGAVDKIVVDVDGAAIATTVVTLTAAQQATVTAASSLANAAAAVLGVAGADGNVATFTYGSDTYLIVNGDGNGTYDNANDALIKITGVTGTLDATDITLL